MFSFSFPSFFPFFFPDPAPSALYTLSLHDALPIFVGDRDHGRLCQSRMGDQLVLERDRRRSEEHTSELQSLRHLVCRLLLEKKKKTPTPSTTTVIDAPPHKERRRRTKS